MVTEPAAEQMDLADEMLKSLANRGRRAIKILIDFLVVVSLALAVVTGLLIYNNDHETARVQAAVTQAVIQQQQKDAKQCNFYGLLAQLPVASSSTKAGVTLVADSRIAYVGLGCKPDLAPPSHELSVLANKYHIQIPG